MAADNGRLRWHYAHLYYNREVDGSFTGNRDAIAQSPYELFVKADRYNDSVVYLAGGIDDLRLYKRVLSEVETRQLYETN